MTIIEMLNQIRARNKPVRIETINQPFYLADEDKLASNYHIANVATDDNGVYLLHTNTSAYKVSPEGITTTEEREELINLACISRIVLS